GHRDGRQGDGSREAATPSQADGGRRGLATDERDGSRVCGEREVRPSGAEELERRGRVHVPLSEAASAPDVFQELRERIVTIRGRRLVRQLGGGTAEGHVDVRRTRVRLVEHEDERGLL